MISLGLGLADDEPAAEADQDIPVEESTGATAAASSSMEEGKQDLPNEERLELMLSA